MIAFIRWIDNNNENFYSGFTVPGWYYWHTTSYDTIEIFGPYDTPTLDEMIKEGIEFGKKERGK